MGGHLWWSTSKQFRFTQGHPFVPTRSQDVCSDLHTWLCQWAICYPWMGCGGLFWGPCNAWPVQSRLGIVCVGFCLRRWGSCPVWCPCVGIHFSVQTLFAEAIDIKLCHYQSEWRGKRTIWIPSIKTVFRDNFRRQYSSKSSRHGPNRSMTIMLKSPS